MKHLLLGAIRRHAPILLALALVGVLSGCAHPISLAGTPAALAGTGGGKVAKGAALVISDEDRKREVVSPGGGGDKVSYLPYRDLEVGLYLAMSETFERLTRVTGPYDPKVKQERLDYVLTPTGMASFLMLALLVFAAIFVFRLLTRKNAAEPRMAYAGGNDLTVPASRFEASTPLAGGAVAGIPAGFDAEGFLRQAKLNFLRLQGANDAGNMDDIRQFTSPEMFAEVQMQYDRSAAGRRSTPT